jgi:hypothetical protein
LKIDAQQWIPMLALIFQLKIFNVQQFFDHLFSSNLDKLIFVYNLLCLLPQMYIKTKITNLKT